MRLHSGRFAAAGFAGRQGIDRLHERVALFADPVELGLQVLNLLLQRLQTARVRQIPLVGPELPDPAGQYALAGAQPELDLGRTEPLVEDHADRFLFERFVVAAAAPAFASHLPYISFMS